MQRWIVIGVLLLVVLAGGGIGFWKWKDRSYPDRIYYPMPFNPDASPDQRKQAIKEFRDSLLTDNILTGVVRDCNVVTMWKLPSEAAAVEDLRQRAILEEGVDKLQGTDLKVIRFGFRGVKSENKDLQALSTRFFQDVLRLVEKKGPAKDPASAPPAPAPANP